MTIIAVGLGAMSLSSTWLKRFTAACPTSEVTARRVERLRRFKSLIRANRREKAAVSTPSVRDFLALTHRQSKSEE